MQRQILIDTKIDIRYLIDTKSVKKMTKIDIPWKIIDTHLKIDTKQILDIF